MRVVIEVGGEHHYSNASGRADPERYAGMVRADCDLTLAGYDVYRFGVPELDERQGADRVGEFFTRLFRRYGVAG